MMRRKVKGGLVFFPTFLKQQERERGAKRDTNKQNNKNTQNLIKKIITTK